MVLKNKEHIKEYYGTNKEHIKEYYGKNKEHIKEYYEKTRNILRNSKKYVTKMFTNKTIT